jgi:tyrosine-protein phosphatase SIW14
MTDLMTQSPPTQTPTVRRHRRRTWLILTLLIVGTGAGIAIKNYRHQFFAKRFAEVVPGRLYRAGYCEPRPLTRIIRDYKIKTILVLLNDEPDSLLQQKEVAVAQREGVRLIRIPMPGDGIADFDALDQAAGIIADPANQPLLVHCYAGTMRTGASYAAWRMRHCGWSYQQAADECEDYELSPYYNTQFFEHLKRYYSERVAAPTSKPA